MTESTEEAIRGAIKQVEKKNNSKGVSLQQLQGLIKSIIKSNKQLIAVLLRKNEELESTLVQIININEADVAELEKILLLLFNREIDIHAWVETGKDPLLRLARKDYIIIFVPHHETELLRQIGNIGRPAGKVNNYIGFLFDKETDPRIALPDMIKDDVEKYFAQGFERELTIEGRTLVFPPQHKEKIKKKYGKYLLTIDERTATIKPKSFFDFLTELGEQGYFIYSAGPYPREILRELDGPSKIKMTDHVVIQTTKGPKTVDFTYQKEVVKDLPKYKHATIAFKTGGGKTIVTLAHCRNLKGHKLILVDSDIARSQWREDVQKWVPEIDKEITIETYAMLTEALKNKGNALWKKIKEVEEFSLVVYDEGERPFNFEWGKSLSLKSVGRLFLSATPFPRLVKDEIARRNLFGHKFPADWRRIMQAQKKEFAKLTVNILKNDKEKIARLVDRLKKNQGTKQLIFCRWKDKQDVVTGHTIKRALKYQAKIEADFIHGDTAGDKRVVLLETLERDKIVITTLARRSISIKDLATVHLFDPSISETLGIQEIGRLGHSEEEQKEGQIYFTGKDLENEEALDWLFFLLARGYKINWPDGRPDFSKYTTLLDRLADDLVEEQQQAAEQEKSKPVRREVSARGSTISETAESFFDNEIILERIREMLTHRDTKYKGLLKKILALLSEYATLSKDDILQFCNVKKGSISNVDTATNTLADWGLIIKDKTKTPYVISLNFAASAKIKAEQAQEKRLNNIMQKFDEKLNDK